MNDGTVMAWGANKYGVLGDGSEIQKNTPEIVSGLSGVKQIAVVGYHIVFINDVTVKAWGCMIISRSE